MKYSKRFHIQGLSSPIALFDLEEGTNKLSRDIGRWYNNICLASQKIDDLIDTAVDAWNHFVKLITQLIVLCFIYIHIWYIVHIYK
jgi:hypothetical protein